ncbi:MAG: type IV pilus secretin PilQ [Granulosicoccaceae bacterium]
MNSKRYNKTSVNGDITCSRKTQWLAMAALAGSMVLPAELMAAQNALKSLSFNQLPGNLLELRLKMENPADKPNGFTIDNPARIALDFADTRNDLAKRTIPVDTGNVRSINAVEFQGRTRLIVNLNELSPYSTTVDGEDVLIRLSSGGAQSSSAAVQPTVVSSAAIGGGNSLSDMHFRRAEDGAGRVTFKLSDPNTPIDIKQIGQKVVIDMREVDVPDSLLKRLDVMDFATPIQFIDTYRRGENVRIEIRPSRGVEYEQIAYQSDNHFTLELRPLAEEEVQARKEQTFEGERLSLNFQDIEVRSVLQLLADFTDQNVVVSDSVEGEVTLRLKNVPWDQALDIILKSKGLAMRQNGNVLMVAPADEIAAREQLELESAQKVHKLSKLRTEMIQINYAKAETIADVLLAGQSESNESEGGASGSADAGLLTDRGNVSIDERTNTVLITDTAESLEKIHALVAKLDVPVRQVLIESRVVIATDDFNEEMGMRVGLTRYPDNNVSGGYGITSGNLGAVTNVYNQAIAGETDEEVEAPNRWNVNLPASNPAGSIGFNFGTLPLGAYLELELSAMEAEGRGEVVSSPRVITANQHEAHIEQGVEIPYLEASSSGAATVSFKKAVLGLNVTPQITPDDRIIMDLTVNKDSVGEWYGAGENQVPTVDTREVNTQVLVDNGETVVLGGIYEQVRTNSTRKVPFLGDLPILGRLFRTDLSRDEKNELLIFVTPKIIGDSTASR